MRFLGHATKNYGVAQAQIFSIRLKTFINLDGKFAGIEKFGGGPVGLNTVAVAVGEDSGTLEDVFEPYLIQQGFLERTPRGRCATALAYRRFGITPPPGQAQLFER